jgi:hypothetical protein
MVLSMKDAKKNLSPRGEVIGVGKFKVKAALIRGNVMPRLSFCAGGDFQTGPHNGCNLFFGVNAESVI